VTWYLLRKADRYKSSLVTLAGRGEEEKGFLEEFQLARVREQVSTGSVMPGLLFLLNNLVLWLLASRWSAEGERAELDLGVGDLGLCNPAKE